MFVQLHLLTSYPPSNLNRDDLGRPKTAMMGGVPRLRVSSQSLKRAWRTSTVFQERLQDALSLRTRRLALDVRAKLLDNGVEAKLADETARAIGAAVYGKLEEDEFVAGQLAFIGPAELVAVKSLTDKVVETGKAPTEDEAKAVLQEQPRGADLALFGRMLASSPGFNVEAAAEVAHALTIHRAEVEDDYFTAVDDLQKPGEDEEGAGAGFVGEAGFGAGLFYLYICVDLDLLTRNLGGDAELARAAAQALVQAAATVGPSGKRASFASRAYASYVLAERGDTLPRSLSVAFLSPKQKSKDADMLADAVAALQGAAEKMDRAYGATAAARYRMDVAAGVGDLGGLLAFVAGEPGNFDVATA